MERLGKWDCEDLHILCFADYCKTHFKDIPAFQNLSFRSDINIVIYYLTKLGIAVFVNTTRDVETYGYTGFFSCPNFLTDEQIESIHSFLPELNGFKIKLNYDLSYDGIVSGKTLDATDQVDTTEVFERYLKETKNLKNIHRK